MSNRHLFFSERLLHSFIFKAISTALIISIFLLQTGIVSFAEEAASSSSAASSTDTGTTGDTTTGGDGGGGTDGTGIDPGMESMSAMGGGSLLSNLAQSYLPTTFQTDFFTGKANLAIPVAVPPGRRNLSPVLSFNYTSGNPNSWVGIGWDMSLGTISRSTKNGPPKYDSTDTYILGLGGGGGELVNIGGTEYRAKQESAFLKIVQSGTYWEVTDKAGTKYLFGFYGSYSSNASGTYKWYLDKVIDVHGNYVKVTYVIDYGQLYPQFIDYTGNETTGLLPTNKVQFFLELRNDIEFDYRSGYQIQMRYRLLRIDITTSGSLVRSYKPNYTYITTTGRTQLTSIVQYGEDGVSALPATSFGYQTKDNAFIGSGTWLAGWLSGYTSSTGNTLTGDFNGDGLGDIGVYDAVNGNWLVALSTGSGFSPQGTWLAGWLPGFTGPNGTSLTGDFNGDGKTDVGIYDATYGNWLVALSTGSSFSPQGTWLAGWLPGYTSTNGHPIGGDYNGDSKQDIGIYDAINGNWLVALSTGSSFSPKGTWLAGWLSGYTGGNGNPIGGDFNADGVSDIGIYDSPNGNWLVALSTGSAFSATGTWLANWLPGFTGHLGNTLGGDFNGDGLSDIGIYDATYGNWLVAVSKGSNLSGTGFSPQGTWLAGWLAGFTGATGNVIQGDFNGDALTDVGIYDSPNGNWLVAKNKDPLPFLLNQTTNGVGGTTNITYKPSTIYDNTGGDGIPDLPFPVYVVDSTTSQDGLGNSYVVTNTYQGGLYNAQEREFRGFNYASVKDAANNYSEKYFYQDNVYKGLTYRLTAKDSTGNLYTKVENTYQNTNPYPGVNFPHLSQQDIYTYDGDTTYKQARANYTYDSYGNVTVLNNRGDVSITTDDLTQTTEYTYNTTKWILSKPSRTYTTHDSQSGAIVRQSWFYYDNNTLYTQPPTYGDLTKEERWLNGGTNPIVQYQYDTYGNMTSSTDPRNNTSTIGYDTATYTFPITYTNPLSHVQSYTYDAETGQVLTSQDPNNAITTNVYDTFKRLIKVIGPNDTEASPLITYAYDLTTNPTKVTITQKTGGEPYTTYIFTDGLGRQIETKTPAEDPTKQIVTGIVKFNNRGLLQEVYLPYYTTLTTGYTTPDYLQPKTSYTYDAIGRLTQTTNPDNTTSTTAYSDWTVTKTDENNHQTKYYNDAFGKMTKVGEYNGVNIYTTQYEYNAVGDLTKTIDNLNNQSTISYDTLSRKVNMTDPDMGPWTYTYDAAGNLLTQTDAKSQTITFTYDALNRLTLKDYPTGTDVTYTYDLNTNGKGRLTQVQDTSGTTQFWYDNLGREIKSTKTIDATPYTVERAYDSLDRLTTIKYPDNETLTYGYNLQGQIETVTSCITSIDYSATGQITRINYANGTYTDYTYNPNTLRLSTLKTNNGTIQNLSYGFDNAGNVTSIQDILNARTQTLTYDDLNRLITATGGYGTKNYSYNSIGNILTKDGLTYTYGTKPHAVTSTSDGTNYTYDTNGNMTAKGTSTYTYDYDNRLTQVTATGGTTTFVYDGDGGRVKKTTGSGTTVYIGSLYEVTVTGSTRKHIFLNSNRVQIKESTGNIYYIHSDHLGSSNVVTDGNAIQVQKLEYDPFGTIWSSQGSDITKHKYTGKELDDTTGLYFYGARYYDPSLGRFITADTIVPNPSNPQDLNRYSYCNNNPINYTDPTGHWSWKKFLNSFVGAFVAVITAIVLGPAGLAWYGSTMSWAIGGALGGAITGGLEGGWQGALIGAVTGGALGGLGGWGVGEFGKGFGYGMLIAGAGVAGATDSWDSLAGGLVGGITGGIIGKGIVKSEQFQNWKERRIRAAEYKKALDALNVSESDKIKVTVGSRPLTKADGGPGSPTGPRHRYLRWTENGQEQIWEMGPDANKLISTRNTAPANWGTATTTDLSIGTPYAKEVTLEMSLSGLRNGIFTYESFWVGQPYGGSSYNSNYAVNSLIYGAKANVPEGIGITPGFPDSP